MLFSCDCHRISTFFSELVFSSAGSQFLLCAVPPSSFFVQSRFWVWSSSSFSWRAWPQSITNTRPVIACRARTQLTERGLRNNEFALGKSPGDWRRLSIHSSTRVLVRSCKFIKTRRKGTGLRRNHSRRNYRARYSEGGANEHDHSKSKDERSANGGSNARPRFRVLIGWRIKAAKLRDIRLKLLHHTRVQSLSSQRLSQ